LKIKFSEDIFQIFVFLSKWEAGTHSLRVTVISGIKNTLKIDLKKKEEKCWALVAYSVILAT
jgi:hypothetical protein